MAITIKTNFYSPLAKVDKPKMYLVYMLYDKHISWDFSMRMMTKIFHKSLEEADAITNEILTNGEGLCGVYMLEMAETKAKIIEQQAKDEGLSLRCLIEEV